MVDQFLLTLKRLVVRYIVSVYWAAINSNTSTTHVFYPPCSVTGGILMHQKSFEPSEKLIILHVSMFCTFASMSFFTL